MPTLERYSAVVIDLATETKLPDSVVVCRSFGSQPHRPLAGAAEQPQDDWFLEEGEIAISPCPETPYKRDIPEFLVNADDTLMYEICERLPDALDVD